MENSKTKALAKKKSILNKINSTFDDNDKPTSTATAPIKEMHATHYKKFKTYQERRFQGEKVSHPNR